MSSSSKGSLFLFGCGYSGAELACQLLAQGWQVHAASRTPEALAEVLPAVRFHRFSPASGLADPQAALDGITHILSTVGPDPQSCPTSGDPILEAHGDMLAAHPAWKGYLSATSVYAEVAGGSVKEDSITAPTSSRGKARLAAETNWRDQCQAEIFRAAGIYGPGRTVFASLLAGTAQRIDKPGHVFNRIHVEDLAAAIITAMANPQRRRILNLADGAPAPQAEVVSYAAGLLEMSPPPLIAYEKAVLSPMARSFWSTSRRVDSRALTETLGYCLRYPDYRCGLVSCLAAERKAGIIPAATEEPA